MVTKIEVCEFARRINIGVKAQMGIRQLSNRALGKLIGRSERYIRDRVKDEQEWRIGDLQLMCKLWDMTFGQLTSYVDLADPQKITGVLTVVYILLFPLFQYVIIESCVLRNGLSVRG